MAAADAALPVARLILATPFAIAGLAALHDPLKARGALAVWGVPARAVNVATAAATLAAIGVAAGLMAAGTARTSAVIAAGILVAVAAAAVVRLVRERPSPATVSALLRSVALAVPASLVLVEGRHDTGPGIVAWLGSITPAQQFAVAAAAVVIAIAWWPRPGRPSSEAQPLASARALPPLETARAAETARRAPALVRAAPPLTIGMATYNDFDGVYFTIQALRLYHDLEDVELLVVDNFGCEHTKGFVRDWVKGTYILATDSAGTAYAKNLVFEKARGEAVLCCDSHVLFERGVVARLKRFYRDERDCRDLLQGPLVYDDGTLVSTHFEPVWREQMWGVWATDPRGEDPDGEPFEIGMQGLGAFSCRTAAWPGFHSGFRGFGGEEGYLHEKVRRAGGRCLCLPWLRWMHRFGRPRGVPYPLTVEDKLRNYLLGHLELGLDTAPVLDHFAQHLAADRIERILAEAHRPPAR